MGGTALVVAGVWVLCQILGGNALGRLGITGGATKPGTTGGATKPGTTASVPPLQNVLPATPYTAPGAGTIHR